VTIVVADKRIMIHDDIRLCDLFHSVMLVVGMMMLGVVRVVCSYSVVILCVM
jgi:hypothetical protein